MIRDESSVLFNAIITMMLFVFYVTFHQSFIIRLLLSFNIGNYVFRGMRCFRLTNIKCSILDFHSLYILRALKTIIFWHICILYSKFSLVIYFTGAQKNFLFNISSCTSTHFTIVWKNLLNQNTFNYIADFFLYQLSCRLGLGIYEVSKPEAWYGVGISLNIQIKLMLKLKIGRNIGLLTTYHN